MPRHATLGPPGEAPSSEQASERWSSHSSRAGGEVQPCKYPHSVEYSCGCCDAFAPSPAAGVLARISARSCTPPPGCRLEAVLQFTYPWQRASLSPSVPWTNIPPAPWRRPGPKGQDRKCAHPERKIVPVLRTGRISADRSPAPPPSLAAQTGKPLLMNSRKSWRVFMLWVMRALQPRHVKSRSFLSPRKGSRTR